MHTILLTEQVCMSGCFFFFYEADFIMPLMLKLETYKGLPWLKSRIKENKKKIKIINTFAT